MPCSRLLHMTEIRFLASVAWSDVTEIIVAFALSAFLVLFCLDFFVLASSEHTIVKLGKHFSLSQDFISDALL